MKKVKKRVQLNLESISSEPLHCSFTLDDRRELTYKFTTYEHIPNPQSMEFYVEVEEPETLKEWLEEKGIQKNELVDWLNENYKR